MGGKKKKPKAPTAPPRENQRPIDVKPSDDTLREQFHAEWKKSEHSTALSLLDRIADKTYWDFVCRGLLVWRLGLVEEALAAFQTSLRLQESAEAHYYCAHLYKYDKKYSGQTDAHQRLQNHIKRAVVLPNCPEGAYGLFNETCFWENEDKDAHCKILKRGVDEHPESISLRLDLSRTTLRWLKKPNDALNVLRPLLDREKADVHVLWLAHECLAATGDLKGALSLVRQIPVFPVDGVSVKLPIGDLELRIGNIEEALRAYNSEIASTNVEANIVGLFSRAKVWLNLGKTEQALSDVKHAVELCFRYSFFHFGPPSQLFLSSESGEYYEFGRAIVEVSKQLFLEDIVASDKRDSHLYAGLSYLLFRATEFESDSEANENEERENPWLARALAFEEHPAFFKEMRDRVADRDPKRAVELHLLHCRWLYKIYREAEYGGRVVRSQYYIADTGDLTKTKALKVHQTAFRIFKEISDPEELKAVFAPFYESSWSKILHVIEKWDDMAAVAARLILLAPESSTIMWDYAVGHDLTGRTEVAEEVYTSYLQKFGDNSSAIHNLSLIAEQRGDLTTAMTRAEKAARLAPSDEKLQKRNKSFEKVRAFEAAAQAAVANAPLFENLSVRDRLYLATVLRCCLSEDKKTIESAQATGHKLAPTTDHLQSILKRLWNRSILLVDPYSDRDSLSLNERGACEVYIDKVRWLLNLRSEAGISRDEMLTKLIEPEELEDDEIDEGVELWTEIALHESIEYLQSRREAVGLEGPVGEKTIEYFLNLLQHFSTSQMYQVIWNAVKNALAFQAEAGISKRHGANLVVNKCKTWGERALADHWDVRGYRRDYNCEQSAISQILYNKMLAVGDAGFFNCPGNFGTVAPLPPSPRVREIGPAPSSNA